MTKHKLTPEQIAAVRRIRTSMAIEGFERTEEYVAEMLAEYFASGEDELVGNLADKARREGRPAQEVIREHYGLPSPPKALG